MYAGCESSDLTSPREPYGRMRDMDGIERGGDRRIGKTVSVDETINGRQLI
jgi:hypothetical protein